MKETDFEKIESKTKVDKETIISLAQKINDHGLKDENTLREVIDHLSTMTGKEVTPEMADKIVETIVADKVPKDVENMF